MKLRSHKSVFQRYYLRSTIICTLYISLVFLCMHIFPNIWFIVICTLLFFPVKILIRISASKTIASPLFNDLNAFQFQQIIYSNKHFIPPLGYRINAAFFTGDYQTVVNIASLRIQQNKRSVKEKYLLLLCLANVYFELRDFEKLKAVLLKYEELTVLYPSKKYLTKPYSPLSYYKYFLNEKYEACKVVCEERKSGINPKDLDAKIRKLQFNFFYAVACYENKDMNEAKECFEGIISYAPQMYFATIAQKYLDAIANGQPPLMSDSEYLPDGTYQLYDKRTVSRRRIGRILVISYSVFVIIAVTFLGSLDQNSGNNNNNNNKFSPQFMAKVDAAIAEEAANSTRIDCFSLYKNDKYFGAFCILQSGNNVDFVEIATRDNNETFDLSLIAENIRYDTYYRGKVPRRDYYIAYMLSSKEPSEENLYYSKELKIDGNTYWFYIDYVETTPKD